MEKREYLDALAKELQPLPYDEQKEALEYYQNYFDDAGLENEQTVIDELGSVQELGVYIRSKFSCLPARTTNNHQNNHSETQTDDYPLQQVKSLNINISATKLEILPKEGSSIGIKIENTGKSRIYSKLKPDGTLKIGTNPYTAWIFPWNPVNFKIPTVFISIPRGCHIETLNIKTEAGSITGKNLDITTSKGDFSVGAGSIQLSGITSETAEIGCNAGNITLSGIFRGRTKIQCNVGSIDLHTTGNIEQYSYAGESNLGTIRINNNNISGIGKQSSDSQKSNHFDIRSNMGSVQISIK